MKYAQLVKSDREGKKYKIVFYDKDRKKLKTTHFGSSNMSDYTKHKDDERKDLYLGRHRANEDWNNPITAGACSRWILWNKTSLSASFNDYLKRFNLSRY
tara:strand:- start:29 stop:328 length:300 start_codon:yes stop_codon:yes gene_type:complete